MHSLLWSVMFFFYHLVCKNDHVFLVITEDVRKKLKLHVHNVIDGFVHMCALIMFICITCKGCDDKLPHNASHCCANSF